MIYLFFLLFLTLPISFVGAVTPEVISPTGILPNVGNDPGTTLASIITFFISISAILAVIAITWGALQMILAAGEEEKIKKGRMIIIYAFVGLLLSFGAFGIVRIITYLQL